MAYSINDLLITTLSQVTHNNGTPDVNHPGIATNGVLVSPPGTPGVKSFNDVDVDSVSFTGVRGREYFDDLYFRIHFEPGAINLGNVLSVQTEEIRVWNAYLSDKEMTDYLEPAAQGVDVLEPVSTPYTLKAQEELSYIVTVSTDGPPQFSEQIVWTIDGVEYTVPVTGQRVVVWPFGPNWDQPLTESLEWKTDVVTAFDGTEDRRQVRTKPRRRTSYRLTLSSNQLNQFQNLLYGWQDRQFALPTWQDKTVLSSSLATGDNVIPVATSTRSFHNGGLAILITDTYTFEVVEIDQVNVDQIITKNPLESDWPVLTELYPLNLATLPADVPTQRITSRVMACNVEFLADPVKTDPFIPGEPAVETLDGYEIIYRKPNWSSPVQYDHGSDFDLIDFETGGVQQIQKPTFHRQTRRIRWLLKNRSDIRDFRAMLGRRKGKMIAAYVPSWFQDFRIVETAGLGASGIKVEYSQYDNLVGPQDTQKWLLIRLKDGTRILREIIGTSRPDAQTEQLNFSESLDIEVKPENTLMISLVHLCRLAQDGVTINYQSDSVATVEMTMVTVRS